MNKWHGVSILFSLLVGDIGLLRYSEACETISSIECVNSTYFFWCVDPGDGILVTIGNAEACPGVLVCDDTQANGCVPANTVATTELTSDSTTVASTDSTATEESSTTESTADLTTVASTDSTAPSQESSTSESTADLTTIASTDSTASEESLTSESTSDSAITVSSTETTTDTTQSTTCEESDADFTCVYEGLYPANDCSRFHVCYKFIWFIKHYFARCSKGLYWSSVEKRCVLQSLSDCP